MTAPDPRKTSRLLFGAVAAFGAAAIIACGPDTFEIPIETPIQPKLDVSPFQRVLVAGFVAGGNEDLDTNQETVRLLRSQLRNKSALKVIDADVMPLIEIAQDQNKTAETLAEELKAHVRRTVARFPDKKVLLIGQGYGRNINERTGLNNWSNEATLASLQRPVLDILTAGARAVLVPFAAERETEQLLRAERLAAMGAVEMLREAELSPSTLAAAIIRAAASEPAPVAIDTGGATRSARIIAQIVRNRDTAGLLPRQPSLV